MIRRVFLVVFSFIVVMSCAPVRGQQPQGEPATMRVNVRNATGAPLSVPAEVRLRQRVGSVLAVETARPGEVAVFRNLPPDDYTIEVSAAGFKTATESATLRASQADAQIFVHLVPLSMPAAPVATSPPVLAPKAAKEVQEAAFALSMGDLRGAQKRLERAEKAAPNHPEIQYLFGMLQLKRTDAAGARQRFEQAIALYPQHVGALSALGRLLFQQSDFAGAADLLERALVVDGRSQDIHSLLATALYELRQLEKARYHAEQSLDLSGGRRPDTRLLRARILAAQGARPQALEALQKFLADYPAHSGTPAARQLMASLESGAEVAHGDSAAPAVMGSAESSGEPEAAVSPAGAWAPKDVDEVPPAVFRDVPCSAAQVVERAAQQVVGMVNHLGDVNASEEVLHTEFDSKGRPGRSQSRKYEYMFAIRRAPPNLLWVEEMRNGAFGGDPIAGTLTSGLAAMALIFHPHFVNDFEVRCEGQGNWRGTPVWFLYFQQRADRPGRFYRYKNARGSVWLRLKGRAWVEANSYQILHMEIGLIESSPQVELDRMQWVIEYGPIEFKDHQGTFWLPKTAETYTHARGKRWYRRHRMSNYVHFAVDTKQKIADPKQAEEPSEDKKPPYLHP